jgi:hypothetical protein
VGRGSGPARAPQRQPSRPDRAWPRSCRPCLRPRTPRRHPAARLPGSARPADRPPAPEPGPRLGPRPPAPARKGRLARWSWWVGAVGTPRPARRVARWAVALRHGRGVAGRGRRGGRWSCRTVPPSAGLGGPTLQPGLDRGSGFGYRVPGLQGGGQQHRLDFTAVEEAGGDELAEADACDRREPRGNVAVMRPYLCCRACMARWQDPGTDVGRGMVVMCAAVNGL